jgi:hypothetical protein
MAGIVESIVGWLIVSGLAFLVFSAVKHPRALQEMMDFAKKPLIYLAIGGISFFALILIAVSGSLTDRISSDPNAFPTLFLQAASLQIVVTLFCVIVGVSWVVGVFVLMLDRLSRTLNPDFYRDELTKTSPNRTFTQTD